jgi:hypothetical protein
VKTLALAVAIVLAGCATSNHSSEANARSIKLQIQSEEISDREQQCIKEAVGRSNDPAAQVARPDVPAGQMAQQADANEDHEISRCKDTAQHDQAALAARARAEYEDEIQEQRDRASLMGILITSRPQ